MIEMYIDIAETGKDYVLFTDGIKLYSKGDLREEAVMSYIHCHYEVWVEPDRFEGNLAKDNLWTLDVPEHVRKELIKRFTITKNDTVLEVGAYVGWGTIKLSHMAKEVIAIEADPDNYEILWNNLIENKIENVYCRNVAVGAKKGTMTLYKGIHGREKSFYPKSLRKVISSQMVEVDTIDDFINKVDYATLTINLGELDALKGMERILKENNVRLIIAGWYKLGKKPASHEIKKYLESIGYDVFIGKINRVYALKL